MIDQALARPVEGLHVLLLDRLQGDEAHVRSLHRLADASASLPSFLFPRMNGLTNWGLMMRTVWPRA
jgi:hypothetical protein